MNPAISLTGLLQQYGSGDQRIANTVFRRVSPRLRELAARLLWRERFGAPFCATELVNEAWIKGFRFGVGEIKSRDHFYAIAVKVMRQVLVDAARHRLAISHGGEHTILSLEEINESCHPSRSDDARILEIDLLLDKLEAKKPEVAYIVGLHYFAGMTLEEIAAGTGLSFRKVRHRWEKGRDWLKDRL